MSVNMNKMIKYIVLIFCVDLTASFPCSQENVGAYQVPHETLQFSNLAQSQNVASNSAYQSSVNRDSIVQPRNYGYVGPSISSRYDQRGTCKDNNLYPGVGLEQNVRDDRQLWNVNSEIQSLIQRETAAQQRKYYDNYFYRNQQPLVPQAPTQKKVAASNEHLNTQFRHQNAPNIQHSYAFAEANGSPLLNIVSEPYAAPIGVPVHNPHPLHDFESGKTIPPITHHYPNEQQLLSITNVPKRSEIENSIQNEFGITIQKNLQKQITQAISRAAGPSKNIYEQFVNRQRQHLNAADYNIQQIWAENPSIRQAFANIKNKKRYLVIYPNGTIEHVDRLETVVERHPSYILVPAGSNIPQLVSSSATTVTKTSPLVSLATASATSGSLLPLPAPPHTSPIFSIPIDSLPSVANLPSPESSPVPLLRDTPPSISAKSLSSGFSHYIPPLINALPSIAELPTSATFHDTPLPIIDASPSIVETDSPATSHDASLLINAPTLIAEPKSSATSSDITLPIVAPSSTAEPLNPDSSSDSLTRDATSSVLDASSSTASLTNDVTDNATAAEEASSEESSANATASASASSDQLFDSADKPAPSKTEAAATTETLSDTVTSSTSRLSTKALPEESSAIASDITSAQLSHSSDKPAPNETEAPFTTESLSEPVVSSSCSTSSTKALTKKNPESEDSTKALPILKTVAPSGLDIKKIKSKGKPSVWFRTTDPGLWEKLVGDDSLYNVVYFFEVPAQTSVEKDTKITEYCNGTIIEEVTETLWETEDGEPRVTKTIKLIETEKKNCT